MRYSLWLFIQIEDLSQQAQMAAAEKFKASEPSFVDKTAKPTVEIPALEEEESDEEVIIDRARHRQTDGQRQTD